MSSPMITLYYTADYELFMGCNHLSPQQALLEPTADLLEQCEQWQIPLTLFADVACLWRFRQWGEHDFVELAEGQLQQAVATGHDVQLHLHPHWLVAERQGKGFHFPANAYALATMATDEKECARHIHALVQQGVDYLQALLRPVKAHYRCTAFRAGGYRLDPRRELLLSILSDHGLQVDSSIIPGYRQAGVDFSQEPTHPGWVMGPMFEVPIAAATFTPWQARRLGWRGAWREAMAIFLQHPSRQRGEAWPLQAVDATVPAWKRAYWHFHSRINRTFAHLAMGEDPWVMRKVLQHFLQGTDWKETDCHVAIIGHPKAMFSSHLTALVQFHRWSLDDYGPHIRLATLGELAAQRVKG
ncbi:MAG: hypothetical protein G8345_17240 [Magnetococcales bacterium]|nr:hypothetical protein [Magnetococcales bacterium]NGZ28623.1 hypothetical protein [Magnetococcales bacterium]